MQILERAEGASGHRTVACFFVFMFFVLVICSDLEGDNLVGGVEEIGVD